MTITKEKLEQWREQHRSAKKFSTKTPEFRQAVQQQQEVAELDKLRTADYYLIRPVKIEPVEREDLPPTVVSLYEKQRDQFGKPGVFEELFRLYGVDFHQDECFFYQDKNKIRNRVEFVWSHTFRRSYMDVYMRLAKTGRLQDTTEDGQCILKLDRKPDPLDGCIAVMLRIALAKGWVEIEGRGSDGFLLELWPQAESLGIVIQARAEQQIVWQQYEADKLKQLLTGGKKILERGRGESAAALPPKKQRR